MRIDQSDFVYNAVIATVCDFSFHGDMCILQLVIHVYNMVVFRFCVFHMKKSMMCHNRDSYRPDAVSGFPVDARRNNNAIIMSKWRCNVILT